MMALLLCASSAIVSAKEQQISVTGTGGYLVVPFHGATGMKPLTVYNSITQGQTNWAEQQVSSNINTLNVDLDWGDPANSLQLTIYSPDGYVFGPYYDSSDGVIDGRINLYIENTNGITEGTWLYEIYGYHVTGTQSYSI